MLQELIKAFLLIFAAEMGDKTQILAMTFATRYKVKEVLLGVMIGAALNHGIAIILGVYLSTLIPMNTVQLIAAAAFIGFGLWTLKKDDDEDEEETKNNYGPVITVAMAFFIGELGDKTQLAAMTLGTSAKYPVFILMGTVLGMIATSGMGIYLGSKLGEKIPEHVIKFASAGIFIFFGVLKLFGTVPHAYITPLNIIIFFVLLVGAIYILAKPSIKDVRDKKMTPLKEAAATLYINTHKIKDSVENICLGEGKCGSCQGKNCPIGYAKIAINSVDATGNPILGDGKNTLPKSPKSKDFDSEKVAEGIVSSIESCLNCKEAHNKNCIVNKSREALETIYFGEPLSFSGDISQYIDEVRKRDIKLAEKIKNRIN